MSTPSRRGFASKFQPWTAADIAFLRANYATLGAARVAAKLGRSRISVMHKAGRIGVSTHRRWTADDDQHLRALWGTMALGHIAKTIQRTPATTYWRARKLGLECGVTRGMESLTAAAGRTGYTTDQLRRILKWANVKLVRTASRPTRRAAYRFHMVDPFDVDEAVVRWLATEEVTPAARARGVSPGVLREWLREAGIECGHVLHEGCDHPTRGRVESAVIDRVVAERTSKKTLSSEARRVGVPVGTLRLWLLRAGVPGTETKVWRIDPADVDRVVAEHRSRRARRAA